jgi:MoxR-like ATPase
MQRVTPSEFGAAIHRSWRRSRHRALFGWGPPGVGKTDVVRQVGERLGVPVVDFRLGQLTPSDLRGMPVVDHATRSTRYYPPEELPRDGEGILLLDEYPQAVPVMQGLAQQLLLARRLGSYELPQGWLVIGLGNRKEDRASVFDMPSQVENRFKHFVVQANLDEWRVWAASSGIHDHIVAFLSFRPELLTAYDPLSRAWPSPRSWHAASEDHAEGASIVPSVGEAAGLEFEAFIGIFASLPHIDVLLDRDDHGVPFPQEQSAIYAVVAALALRADTPERAVRAFRWLTDSASDEWVNLFLTLLLPRLDSLGLKARFAAIVGGDPALRERLTRLVGLLHA